MRINAQQHVDLTKSKNLYLNGCQTRISFFAIASSSMFSDLDLAAIIEASADFNF